MRDITRLVPGRIAVLQFVIVVAIFAAAGPEIIAAMEMTVLLELLGASLFLTAYVAGAKLAMLGFWRASQDILLPAAQTAVIRSDAPKAQKALAFVYVSGYVAWCMGFSFVIVSYGHHVFGIIL